MVMGAASQPIFALLTELKVNLTFPKIMDKNFLLLNVHVEFCSSITQELKTEIYQMCSESFLPEIMVLSQIGKDKRQKVIPSGVDIRPAVFMGYPPSTTASQYRTAFHMLFFKQPRNQRLFTV